LQGAAALAGGSGGVFQQEVFSGAASEAGLQGAAALCQEVWGVSFNSRFFLEPHQKQGCKGRSPCRGPGGCPSTPFFFNCRFRRRRNRQL